MPLARSTPPSVRPPSARPPFVRAFFVAALALAAVPGAPGSSTTPARAHPTLQARPATLFLPALQRLGPDRDSAQHPAPTLRPYWHRLTPTNSVRQVAFSADGGTLWAATDGGLVRWAIATASAEVISREPVRGVAADGAGGTWSVAVRERRTTLVHRAADGSERPSTTVDEVARDGIAGLAGDRQGRLFVALSDGQLWRRDTDGDWTRLREESDESFLDLLDLVPDQHGGAWLSHGDFAPGVLHVDPAGVARTEQAEREGRSVLVLDIALDARGLALLATNRGVARETASGQWTWLELPGLSDTVIAVAEDPAGTLWAYKGELIALAPDGAVRMWDDDLDCSQPELHPEPRCALGRGTGGLAGDPAVGLWAAGDDGWGLLHLEPGAPSDAAWQPWRTADGDVPRSPQLLAPAAEGGLWATGDGEIRLRDAEGAWQRMPIWGRSFHLGVPVDVGPEGSLWSGQYGWLWQRTAQGELIEHVRIGDAPVGTVSGIAATADGGAWIAGRERLARLGPRGLLAVHDASSGLPPGLVGRVSLDARERPVLALQPASMRDPDSGERIWRGGGVAWLDADGAWHHETTADGLPSDTVLEAIALADGRMLAGTEAGAALREAEGGWSAISTTHGLPHPHVWSVAATAAGDLWFGTEAGAARRAADGTWRTWSPSRLPAAAVRDIEIAASGAVWLGTTGALGASPSGVGGAAHLEPDGRVTPVRWVGSPTLALTAVYDLALGPDGLAWLGTGAGRILRAEPEGGFDSFVLHGEVASANLNAIHTTPDGATWFGTRDGLSRRSPEGRIRTFHTGDGLPGPEVLSLASAPEGGLLAGFGPGSARNNGVAGLGGIARREADGRWSGQPELGVEGFAVPALSRDSEGALWLALEYTTIGGRGGTAGEGAGVLRVTPDGRAERVDELVDAHVSQILSDPAGGLYFVHALGEGKGISLRDAQGTWQRWTMADGLPADDLLALARAPDGRLVAAAIEGGLAERLAEGPWRPLHPPGDDELGTVRGVTFDADGRLWVALPDRGLARVEWR